MRLVDLGVRTALAPARVEVDVDQILVHPLVGSLMEMKTLGARWDVRRRAWTLPAARTHMASIRDLLPDAEGVTSLPDLDATPLGDERLFGYQREAGGRLLAAPRGQLLCMSPGLGKTAVAIIAADKHVPNDQVVVVAPAALLMTWQREIVKWGTGDTSTAILTGTPDWDVAAQARWLLVSWDTLARHQDWFDAVWPLWVLDESVLAKSRRSNKSMAIRGGTRKKRGPDGAIISEKHWANLRKGVERVWLLSGSPTTRFVDDLWAQLALIWPRAFPSYWRFAERYCVVEESVWAKTVVGDRRDKDVMGDNSDLVTVVNQEDVLELPEYLFEPPVDVALLPKQQKAYTSMLNDFVAELEGADPLYADNRAAQLVRLQQIVSWWEGQSAKHDAVSAMIGSGAFAGPHLIWTHWSDAASALTARLVKDGVGAVHVSGADSPKVKDKLIESYKRGEIEALVLSLGVGKFGHTLTNTGSVHYVDRTFNADDYFQSLRRVRRIGLTHRPVVLTYRAPGTVEDLVDLNLEGKLQSISRITNHDLLELLRGLGR